MCLSSTPVRERINPASGGDVIGTYCDGGTAVAQEATRVALRALNADGWRHDPYRRIIEASDFSRLGGLASLDDFLEHKQITQNFDGGH